MEKATKPRASASKRKAPAKPAAKTTARKTAAAPARRAAAPLPRAKATPKPKTPQRKPRSKAKDPALPAPLGYLIAEEEISLRAYYLAEERQQHGLPGDSAQDWLTAERQLREEHHARHNGRV